MIPYFAGILLLVMILAIWQESRVGIYKADPKDWEDVKGDE